jgi:ribosomal protein S15P/S13E
MTELYSSLLPNPKIHLMKQLITALVLLLSPVFLFSQDITGLWKGTMYNDSTKQSLPYELFIKKDNKKYSGFTKSYLTIDGKEYYSIKKVKITVAKDGKIVIQDAAIVDNDYPVQPDKNVHQLNVLDLVNGENEKMLDGLFVTNLTKRFNEITGHINVKKMDINSESSLMQYLKKKEEGNEVVAAR